MSKTNKMSIQIKYGGFSIGMRQPKNGESKKDWVADNMRHKAFKKDGAAAEKVLGELYDANVPESEKMGKVATVKPEAPKPDAEKPKP